VHFGLSANTRSIKGNIVKNSTKEVFTLVDDVQDKINIQPSSLYDGMLYIHFCGNVDFRLTKDGVISLMDYLNKFIADYHNDPINA